MLAMKEQFPHRRDGRPWRQEYIGGIEILRGLAAEAGPQSSRHGDGRPGPGIGRRP